MRAARISDRVSFRQSKLKEDLFSELLRAALSVKNDCIQKVSRRVGLREESLLCHLAGQYSETL